MYFLMLRDKRAVNAPPEMKTIICKHEDRQALVDFYKGMIEGDSFKAGTLLADFNIPADDDASTIIEWNEQFFVEHSKKAAIDGVEFYTKKLAVAEAEGKQKWEEVNTESFTPSDLLTHFNKSKEEQVAADAASASNEDVVGDIPEIDPLLAAQAEPLQPEAQF
jgi:hypothetical protein